jgi:hypothetical protein
MSPFAAGSQHGLRYGVQGSGFGTAATDLISLRHTSCSIVPFKRDGKESEELTTERQITDIALGTKKVGGDFGYELSYGELDAMIEAMLGGTWAAAYALTAQTIEINKTSKKLIRASGDWAADGAQVGDFVVLAGSTTTANDATYGPVTAVSALELTIASAAFDTSESGSGTQTLTTTTMKLENGVTSRYFTFERAFTDITQYGVFQDLQIDKWTLEAKLEQKIKGKFSAIGSGVVSYSGTPVDASPTASQENNPFESFDGILKVTGSPLAVVNGLDLSADNQGEADYVILNDGDATAAQMNQGRFKLTGSLDLYFADLTLHTPYLAGQEATLDVFLGTPVDGLAYRIYLPRIKYTALEDSVSNDKRISTKATFQALRESTTNKTIQIWRFPGA